MFCAPLNLSQTISLSPNLPCAHAINLYGAFGEVGLDYELIAPLFTLHPLHHLSHSLLFAYCFVLLPLRSPPEIQELNSHDHFFG